MNITKALEILARNRIVLHYHEGGDWTVCDGIHEGRGETLEKALTMYARVRIKILERDIDEHDKESARVREKIATISEVLYG